MIKGWVRASRDDGTGLEVCAALDIVGSNGVRRSLDVVVDTGFTGLMTLTETIVSDLGLTYMGNRSVTLADGETRMTRTYRAELLWHGQPLDVRAYMMGDRPMIGTGLLSPCRLSIDLWEGGSVIIEEPIPPGP